MRVYLGNTGWMRGCLIFFSKQFPDMELSKIKGRELYNNIIAFSLKYLVLESKTEEIVGVHIMDSAVTV